MTGELTVDKKEIGIRRAALSGAGPMPGSMEDIGADDDGMITKELFKQALPKGMRVSNIEGIIENINGVIAGNELLRDSLRDNIIGFSYVLKEGGYKANDYVNAVKFVSFKIMNKTVTEAWAGTFPQRYDRLLRKGTSNKDIDSHAGQFGRSKLVTMIMEQSLIPTHVLNADVYQKAINVQANLMISADSEKVRSDAANSLLMHLKAPEVSKVELSVSTTEDKSISELRDAVLALGVAQKQAILDGTPVVNIAHSKVVGTSIVNGEIIEGDCEHV